MGADVFEDLTLALDTLPGDGDDLPFPGTDPAAYQTIFVANVRIPGLSTIEGKGFDNRIDRQKVPGSNGVRIIHLGYDPADFVIRTRLWTNDHFQQYRDIVSVVRPPVKGGAPVAVNVSAPQLAMWGVTECKVITGTLPRANAEDAPSIWTVELHCIEFFEPMSTNKGAPKVVDHSVAKYLPGSANERTLRNQGSPAQQNTGPTMNYTPGDGTAAFSAPQPPPPFTPAQ